MSLQRIKPFRVLLPSLLACSPTWPGIYDPLPQVSTCWAHRLEPPKLAGRDILEHTSSLVSNSISLSTLLRYWPMELCRVWAWRTEETVRASGLCVLLQHMVLGNKEAYQREADTTSLLTGEQAQALLLEHPTLSSGSNILHCMSVSKVIFLTLFHYL